MYENIKKAYEKIWGKCSEEIIPSIAANTLKDFPDVRVLLDQNIKGEQCAISQYKNIMDYTKDKDPVTYDLALKILEDELEHEEDLEAIREDIRVMESKLK